MIGYTLEHLNGLLALYLKTKFAPVGSKERVQEKIVGWPEDIASNEVAKFLLWVQAYERSARND